MGMKKFARKLLGGAASREVQQSLFRRRPLFEALERRYLMSAELVMPPPPPHEQASTVAPAQPAAQGARPYLVERAAFQKPATLGEPMTLPAYAQSQAARQDGAAPAGYASAQGPVRQIIFVDPAIDNANQLVQGLYGLLSDKTEGLGSLAAPTGEGPQLQVLRSHDTEIIVLDGRYDGVEQISRVLAEHRELAAVQIMGHGSAGTLTLGTATLGESQLGSYKSQLRSWGDALSQDGDILLYGCNLAATPAGMAFVDSLSAITRADIAAATHTVGSKDLGGDWVLDYRQGLVEAQVVSVARWDGVLATATGARNGGATLVGVTANEVLQAYGSDNRFVFNNDSAAAQTTIELRQGMKQENGVWVYNADDANSNNTLDFSAVKGNVTAIIGNDDSYRIEYSTLSRAGGTDVWTQHVVNVVFKSADGSQSVKIGAKTFNLIGTALDGKTLLDYSGYATGVTVDLSGPQAGSGTAEVPLPTGFGYVRAISGVIGSKQGGNKITVVGDTTVTINHRSDTIVGSGGGNTYIVAGGTAGFSLVQQPGQSGNTLDLSRFGADITARVQTQGGVTVYLGAGLAADGALRDLAGSTALVRNLDIQILVGVAGQTTLDYSQYRDHVTVNLNYQDAGTALYTASGLAGVLNISHVIGAGGAFDNDIVGSAGNNLISVALSTGRNRISGGGGNDWVFGNALATGGATEYIAGVESDARLSGSATTATLTSASAAGATQTVELRGVQAVTLQDWRNIDYLANAGSAYHPERVVTLDGSAYSGDLTLIGSAGNNRLLGGTGHNTFTGYKGSNTLIAQDGAKSNALNEEGRWNFTLSDVALHGSYATDGTALASGVPTPVLDNVLQGRFTDARLNGGLGALLIDASGFSGNTVLVSGLMLGGTIKSGGGSKHQILLLGGQYAITGGSAAGAQTELVVVADGLSGLGGVKGADYVQQSASTGGLGYVSFEKDASGSWIKRAADATSGSTYSHVTRAYVVGGEYANWIDVSRFEGEATLDGSAGLSNHFVIGNAYATQVIGSAGDNTLELSTDGKSVLLDNRSLTIGTGSGQIISRFNHVEDFRFIVSGTGSQVDTTAFTGITPKTYLADLSSGYVEADGPALAFDFSGNRVNVGLEGVKTLQDLFDAIGAAIMVDAQGRPLRIAVDGPHRGQLLAAADQTTAWDFLYALEATLDNQGRLQIQASQDVLLAGISRAFVLMPGMQAQRNADGTLSDSTVLLSQAAYALGLLGAGQLQAGSSSNGLLIGAALGMAHRTEFVLAGSGASVRSGGGENRFVVNYGQAALNTGSGNTLLAQQGARNHLQVNSSLGAVLSDGELYYLDGATRAGGVAFNPGALGSAVLLATNTAGTTVLDASAWSASVTLATSGGQDRLQGRRDHVTFDVLQPSTGAATLSMEFAGGVGNSVQLAGAALLSHLSTVYGALHGIIFGPNTASLDYVLDIGNGRLDQALEITGRNVTIRGKDFVVDQNITLDMEHWLRLEGEKIRIDGGAGPQVLLSAAAITVSAQRYSPWRSGLAQIYTLTTDITIGKATLWALSASGTGVQLSSRIDSADNPRTLVKKPESLQGLLGGLIDGGNKAWSAALAFIDKVSAMAAWAGIKYDSSITVQTQARIVSNSDVSITATSDLGIQLSPMIAKVASIGVGVLQNYARIDVQGTVLASRSITVRTDVRNSLEIGLAPGQVGNVPAVIGVAVGVVLSESRVHIGQTALVSTGWLHLAGSTTGVRGGAGGDITLEALTTHRNLINLHSAGKMTSSDETQAEELPDGKEGPVRETGKYSAAYAKVGVSVGFAYNQLTTQVLLDGRVEAHDAGKVVVQALATDIGSAIRVRTILGGRDPNQDKVTPEFKQAGVDKAMQAFAVQIEDIKLGLKDAADSTKKFFSGLLSSSQESVSEEKAAIKAQKEQEALDKYNADIQKEIDNPSTDFQVGAALGMAMHSIHTQVRIGDGIHVASISTDGGSVAVQARTRYDTQIMVVSSVDDATIADKQEFLEQKNGLTADQPQRHTGADGSDWGSSAAVVVSIDRVNTRVDLAANAAISTQGGAVTLNASTLNQLDPDRLWLVSLYEPFEGLQARWEQANGITDKAALASGAAKAFLGNLAKTLTSSQGMPASFSSWAQATTKSEKLALSGAFTLRLQDVQTRTTVAGLIDTRGAGAAGDVHAGAISSTQRMNLVGNIVLPTVSIGGNAALENMAPRDEDKQGRLSYGKEQLQGFLRPKIEGFDYGSSSKQGAAIGVSVYVGVASHDTQAVVTDSAVLHVGDLVVAADHELVAVTLGASGAQGKTVALNGVVQVTVSNATTQAQVGRGAQVSAAGAARITAQDATWIGAVAGAAASSQAVGIGMSVAINDVNRRTRALIGDVLGTTPTNAPTGRFSAAALSLHSENKGFVGSVSVAGARVASPGAGAGSGTNDGAASSGGTGTDTLALPAPASQGGAQAGTAPAAQDPDAMLSLQEILAELSAQTSTLTQDSGGAGSAADSQPSKAGVAVSGGVAVNLVNDRAQAYVNAAGMAVTIGGDMTLDARNSTPVLALSGALALAQSDGEKTNLGLAGAYSMNLLDGEARAEVTAAGLLRVGGDLALSARRTGVGVTLAAGMAGAKGQKGVAVAGSAAVALAAYENIARVLQADEISARNVTLNARDQTVLVTVAGAAAVSSADQGAGVGAALAVNLSGSRVEAGIQNVSRLLYTGQVDVQAESRQVVVGFAGGLGAARDGTGAGGSVTVNIVANRIESYLLHSHVQKSGNASGKHDVSISAQDRTTLVAVAGAVGLGEKAGVGMAVSYNAISNAVMAGIQAASVDTQGQGAVSVRAEDLSSLGGGALGVGVGMGGDARFAGAGSVQVNRVDSAVAAYVLARTDASGAVLQRSDIRASALSVQAIENNTLVAVTGGAAAAPGGTAAVGAAVSFNTFSTRTSALIEHADIDVQGQVAVTAHASPLLVSVSAAGALSKQWALAGAVNVNLMRGQVQALISDSRVKAGQAAGFVGDAVRVQATDAAALYAVTLGGAVATEGAAVGLAIAVNIMGGTNAFDRNLLSLEQQQLADSGAQVSTANVADSGPASAQPKVTAALVRSQVQAVAGNVNVFAGLVDPMAAGGNSQLNGGDLLAVGDNGIVLDQGGSTLVFTGAAADTINGKSDASGNAASAGAEFAGWQSGDGIYLSAGAAQVRLADGSSLRSDRMYYIIRRDAPDGQAILQLAGSQEDALRGKALQFASVGDASALRFAHVRMQETLGVNLQPFHGVNAGASVDSANHRLVLDQAFAGLQEGSAIVYSGALDSRGQLEDVLARRILKDGKDLLQVGVSYYVVNLSADQKSFQLRDSAGRLIDFSGASVGGALQRFSVDNSAGALLNADGSLSLPRAHGLATGDTVVVQQGSNGVLTGLENDHVYRVEVVDGTTLRFKNLDGSAVTLGARPYLAEFDTATKRYAYFLADGAGHKLLHNGLPVAVNPDALLGITRVHLQQQTAQTQTSTAGDGTQQTTITAGPARDASLTAQSVRTQVAGESSLQFAADQGLATGDVVVYRSQGTQIAGLVDGQRYYVINASQGGSHRYQLASSLENAKDGLAIVLGASSGSGGVALRKVVDRVDSGGGLIVLDMDALTQGRALTSSMLSITVAGAGGQGLGGAGAIGVNVGRTQVSAYIDNSESTAEVRADAGTVSVSAQDASRIVTASGALGLASGAGSAALGASVGVVDMRNEVRAYIAGATVRAQSVQVLAEERASIHNVAVGLAGGKGAAVSGSLAVNRLQNTVHAQIRDASVTSAGEIRIAARDTASITALAGNVAVSAGGRVAAGMAFAVNQVFDTVYAGALRSALNAGGDIVVLAVFAQPDDLAPGLNAQISAMAVSGAVAAGGEGTNLGFGGSAVLNWIANTITAELGETAAAQDIVSYGDILVQASDRSSINSLAGAVALGLGSQASAAVGASLSYNYLGGAPWGVAREHAVTALLRDTDGAVRAGHVQVTSLFEGRVHNVTLAGSVAVGTLAVSAGGAVSVNRISSHNTAGIRNARLVQALEAGGAPGVVVQARDDGYVLAVAGGLGVAVSTSSAAIAVGVSATDNRLSNETQAFIEDSQLEAANGLTLDAINASRIVSTSLGVAAAVAAGGGFGGAGAGAGSGNSVDGSVQAWLKNAVASVGQGAVRVNAQNEGSILAVAGALGVAVSAGAGGVGASVGVSVAINRISTRVQASVENTQLRTGGGRVSVTASDTGSVTAIAIGGAVAVQAGSTGLALAVGTSVALNEVFNSVHASIQEGSLSTAGGALAVQAVQQADIVTVVLGASVAVSLGSSLNVAVGGGGALARNVVSASVRATLEGTVIDTSGAGGERGALEVLALGLSQINAVVLGMSAAVSVSQYAAASASVGVAMAENAIGYGVNSAGQMVALGAGRPVNEIFAGVERSMLTAGMVTVDARNARLRADGSVERQQSINAVVVSGAVAVSVAYAPPVVDGIGLALSGAGAGARAVNKIKTAITAQITDQAQAHAWQVAQLSVQALDRSRIDSAISAVAVAVSVSAGVSAALSVAVSLAENSVDNAVLAHIDQLHVATTPAISVKADSQAHIAAVSVAVSLAAGLGLGGAALAGGGATAQNSIGSSAVALVSGARLHGNASNALVIAANLRGTLDAKVVVASLALSAGGASLAVGASTAENRLTASAGARAGLVNSQLDNLGDITVSANSVQQLDSMVFAGAVGVALQGQALAGAGASATNVSQAVTRAYVEGLTQQQAASRAAASLRIAAHNTSTLNATALGASLAGSSQGLALSVGVALASNQSLGAVEAWLDSSRLSADAGEQMAQVQLSAQDESTLRAKAIGASLGFAMSGGSLSVGASVARNVAASSVQARVRDTTLSLSGALNVSARETAVLDGVAVAASVAAGFSGASVSGAGAEGSHVAANEVGSRIVGSSVTAGTGVSVTADNTASITAVTGAASMAATGAGLAASIGVSIAGNTFGRYEGQGVHRRNAAQASIDNSTISVDKGDIAVLATSSETLDSLNFAGAVAVAGAGGALAGSGVQVRNLFSTLTTADLSASSAIAGLKGGQGSIKLQAQDSSRILQSSAYGVAVAAALPTGTSLSLALAVTLVDSRAENEVSAGITTAAGKNAGAQGQVSVLALQKTDFAQLYALTASVAVGGLSGAGAGVRVSNSTSNRVSASIAGAGQVGALQGVELKADTQVTAGIDLTRVGVAVGAVAAAIGAGVAENVARDSTTATVDRATVSAPRVQVSAQVGVDFSRTHTAGVAASTGLSVNVNRALVDIATTTLADVRNGARLLGVSTSTPGQGVTPGVVNVDAIGHYYGSATSKAITGGVVGVGVMQAEARLAGTLQTRIDSALLQAEVVGVSVVASTQRGGEAGLTAQSEALEVGGVTVALDSAKLTTSLDAGLSIQGARLEATLLSLRAEQVQALDVRMDAGTLALVAGRQGKVDVDVAGAARIDIGGGAFLQANKIDVRSQHTVLGGSTLTAYSVGVLGADFNAQNVTLRQQATISVSGTRSALSTAESAGMTVLQALGDYQTPGMLDLVASNDLHFRQTSRITGVQGLAVTQSRNYSSTDGMLSRVKVDGAFVHNRFGDLTLAANTRAITSTLSDVLVVTLASDSQSNSRNDLIARNAIEIRNASLEADNIVALAGSGKATDTLSTGYLLATDRQDFTLVGVGVVPHVSSGATARQVNTIVIDGGAAGGSLLQAQRNVRLETNPATLDQAQVQGAVRVIGLNLNPGRELAEGVVDRGASRVAIGAATRIVAGMNNAANLFVIPRALLEQLGLGLALPAAGSPARTFNANDPSVKAMIEALLGLGKTSADGAGGTVNINARYELAAFAAQDIAVNVTAGMIVQHGNDYYRYNRQNSLDLSLATEDYSRSYWTRLTSPTSAQRAAALSSDFGSQMIGEIGGLYFVLKTVGIDQPTLVYANQNNVLREQVGKLQRLQREHSSDPQAVARYQASIAALEQQLQSLQMTTVVDGKIKYLDSFSTFFLDMPDLYAGGGSVYIQAADTSGIIAANIDARAHAQINVVNDSPLGMNVHDAVVLDGTIIRTSLDGGLKVFGTGHVYINDVSAQGQADAGSSQVLISQMRKGWAADPFGGAFDDASMTPAQREALRGILLNTPVDLTLLGSVVNPLGKVSVVNQLGSISVYGAISAESLDIVAKGNFSLQSEGWVNTGADPTLLSDSWARVMLEVKKNAQSTGASDTQEGVLLNWNYQRLSAFSAYLGSGSTAANARIFALGAVNISALTLNIDGKIQSGVTDAYIRIDSRFVGDRDKALQDERGQAIKGVSYSANNTLGSFGAITGRFDYATQTIILDAIRLAGGSISLTGQIISVGNGNLVVANGYASVHIDNQSSYALLVPEIDVSTYRRGRIEIIDTARGQRDLYELQGQDQVVHTQWNRFMQVGSPGSGPQEWIWTYVDGGTSSAQGKQLESGRLQAGQTLSFSYKPQAGQMMVWVMGWSSGVTTSTVYSSERFNLVGDWDPLGWLTDESTTVSDPVTVYETPRPVLVSTVVAYDGVGAVPEVLKAQLAASGLLQQALLPGEIDGSRVYTRDAAGNVTSSATALDTSVFSVAYRKFNTEVHVAYGEPEVSGGGWLRTKTVSLEKVVEKKQQELFTFYVPASQDITLSFLGSSTAQNAVYIRSDGDITLAGNLIVGNGQSVHLQAGAQASIHMQDGFGIFARERDGHIPDGDAAQVNVHAQALEGTVTLHLQGSKGWTRVLAGGDIRLDYFSNAGQSSWAQLEKLHSSSGNVYVQAMGGIFSHGAAGAQTVVTGQRVELNAGYGAIGTQDRALSVDARQGFAAQAGLAGALAGADKGIYLVQNVAKADLVLVKPTSWANPQAAVYSELGGISITLNGGSLLDGELADTRTATEKSHAIVTARILAQLQAQIEGYDRYWSGVRALQPATIRLGGAGTYLSTQAESGQYLALQMTAQEYAATLQAAVQGQRLVRLAYNNSLHGNAREELLGVLALVSESGGIYRFSFAVYDPATGQQAAPVALASLGYTAGSQGMLYGPAYGLADVRSPADLSLEISLGTAAGPATAQPGSLTLRVALSVEQIKALAGGTRNYQAALDALRSYTWVEVGGQRLLVDQILPSSSQGLWNSFDNLLITLKTPYLGAQAGVSLDITLLKDDAGASQVLQAKALRNGLMEQTTSGGPWWNEQSQSPIALYRYTEMGSYGDYVALGDSFSWDLNALGMGTAARQQLAHALKSLLQSGQAFSLSDRQLYLQSAMTADELDLYASGALRIVAVFDRNGQPLDANSPDSAWLSGRVVFSGQVYALRSELDALERFLHTNAQGQTTAAPGGLRIQAGIRLLDGGFAAQALTPLGAAELTLEGQGALLPGQRVELTFAHSAGTFIYYIKTVNGRSVTLADNAEGAFDAGQPALSLAQILQVAGAAPGGRDGPRARCRREPGDGRRRQHHHARRYAHRAAGRRHGHARAAGLRPHLSEWGAGGRRQGDQPAKRRSLLRATGAGPDDSIVRHQGAGRAVPAAGAAAADARRAGPAAGAVRRCRHLGAAAGRLCGGRCQRAFHGLHAALSGTGAGQQRRPERRDGGAACPVEGSGLRSQLPAAGTGRADAGRSAQVAAQPGGVRLCGRAADGADGRLPRLLAGAHRGCQGPGQRHAAGGGREQLPAQRHGHRPGRSGSAQDRRRHLLQPRHGRPAGGYGLLRHRRRRRQHTPGQKPGGRHALPDGCGAEQRLERPVPGPGRGGVPALRCGVAAGRGRAGLHAKLAAARGCRAADQRGASAVRQQL